MKNESAFNPFFEKIGQPGLSLWAKNHPGTAQLCIAAGHILTAVLCVNLGVLLLAMGVGFADWLLFFLAAAFAAAVGGYPFRSECLTGQTFHKKRRLFDVALLTLGVTTTVFLANRLTSNGLDFPPDVSEKTESSFSKGAAWPLLVIMPAPEMARNGEPTTPVFQKKTKNNVFEKVLQKRLVKKFHRLASPERSQGEQILLVILMVALILGLEFLLAAWACNLACSGAEGFAVFVLFGGLTGLTGLSAWCLRGLFPELTKGQRILYALLMVLLPPLSLIIISWVGQF